MNGGVHGEQLLQELGSEACELLRQAGEIAADRDEEAYLVGGPVRDLLLGRAAEDLDIVVVGDGMALAQALARARGGSLTRYPAFQTARIDFEGSRRVDVATARREEYPRPGQLPRVAAGTLRDDLARRDFTINTMALALHPDRWGQLEDPFDARSDLQQGLIRILHERSFADDPTRMLRALRFALRFQYRLEERTAAALHEAARGTYLRELTGDRLRREVRKLLEEAPVSGPEALVQHGLLAAIHPDLRYDRDRLERVQQWLASGAGDAGVGHGGPQSDAAEPGYDPGAARAEQFARVERWCLVLAVLAAPLAAQQRWRLARRLRLSREQRRALIDSGLPWSKALRAMRSELDALCPSGVAQALDGLSLEGVLVGASGLQEGALQMAVCRYLQRDRWVQPVITGRDLAALGLTQGPRVGEVLRALRAALLDGKARTERQQRALARRLSRGSEVS